MSCAISLLRDITNLTRTVSVSHNVMELYGLFLTKKTSDRISSEKYYVLLKYSTIYSRKKRHAMEDANCLQC